jgi:hypothetical protein
MFYPHAPSFSLIFFSLLLVMRLRLLCYVRIIAHIYSSIKSFVVRFDKKKSRERKIIVTMTKCFKPISSGFVMLFRNAGYEAIKLSIDFNVGNYCASELI